MEILHINYLSIENFDSNVLFELRKEKSIDQHL